MHPRSLTSLLLGTTLLAGAGAGPGRDAHDRKLAQRRPGDLAGADHPGLRGEPPGHQAHLRALGAARVQLRAERQARRRIGGRPHRLPAVRPEPRALQQGQARRPHRPRGDGELLRRRQVRLDDRRRLEDLLRADGERHPRLHLQQAGLRRARADRAGDRGRVLRAARQDQGGRHLHPDGDGHQRPVGSRDHGLPEHRPELLEGRGGPAGADQGRAEADRRGMGRAVRRSSPSGARISATASRRRPTRTARTSSPSAAPRSTRPGRGRSRRSRRRSRAPSRWGPSRRRCRTQATSATSPTTSTSRWG